MYCLGNVYIFFKKSMFALYLALMYLQDLNM